MGQLNTAFTRQALGLAPYPTTPGDAEQLAASPDSGRRWARSDLIDRFPGLDFKGPFGFTQIGVVNPTIAAGGSAWYKFASIRVPGDTGQQVGLIGWDLQLLPTDNAGQGDEGDAGATALTWGTARGHGAAIVIGANLPGDYQTWSNGPANILGVETSGLGVLSSRLAPSYAACITFPPGKLNDTIPSKLYKERSYKPYIYRLGQGDTLDAALVVRRASITGLTKTLFGECVLTLDVGLTRDRRAFGGA